MQENPKQIFIPNKSRQRKKQSVPKIRVCTALGAPFVVENTEESKVEGGGGSCRSGHYCNIPVFDSDGQTVVSQRRGCCVGYAIDIFNIVKQELGFEYDLYVVPDNKYGLLDKNGRWNGLVGELVEGRADFALQALSITSLRASAVLFTSNVLTSNYGIIRTTQLQNDEKSSGIGESNFDWSFATALSPLLVVCIALSTILVVLLTFVYENIMHWIRCTTSSTKADYVYFPIREVLSYTIGLCFQRDMGATNPRRWAGRLTALGYAAAMTVVMSAYTARITVSSITDITEDDFKGFYSDEVRRICFKCEIFSVFSASVYTRKNGLQRS